MIRFYKNIGLILVFSFISIFSFSQDQVILKNDSVVKCNVLNINSTHVQIKIDNQYPHEILLKRVKDFKIGKENIKFQLLDDSVAQTKEIRFQKSGFSTKIYLENKKLTSSEAKSLLYKNDEAFVAYKNGKGIEITGTVIASLGGLAFIGSFFTFLAPEGGDIVPIAISAGTAMIGVTLFYTGANKQKRAIENYNSQLNPKVSNRGFKMGVSQSGIGIVYCF